MENLNKQQIILLTLLVSFVTSIATGITTVSLLEQAPRGVTQTINQIVERTVEKVVPGESKVVQLPGKEVTVVVKEEDLVVDTVASAKNSLVRIKNKRSGEVLGIGVVVRADGLVLAPSSVFGQFREYEAIYKDQTYSLTYLDKDNSQGVIFLRLPPESVPQPIVFASIQNIKSGQSVVAISGGERDVVSIGILSSLVEQTKKVDGVETKELSSIETTIGNQNLIAGSLLLNLSGELIGQKVGSSENGSDLIKTVNILTQTFNQIP